MKKLTNLDEKFNKNVLAAVCLVGLVRVILELNSNTPQSGQIDFFLDVSYGVIFVVTLVALFYKAPYEFTYFSFFVPLIILLCLTLIDRRGLASSTENNIHVGIIVISLTMRGRDAIKFSLFLIAGAAISLAIVEYQNNFFIRYSDYSTSNFNFIYMGIGTVLIMYYAKSVFEKSKKQLSDLESNLSYTYDQLDTSRSKLEQLTTELEELNKDLENKVDERVSVLNAKKLAMKAYLKLTIEELEKEHSNYHKLAEKVLENTDDDISKMIAESSTTLKNEIDLLMAKLKEEQ